MNINNQEPPRKRSRDQQHTSNPTTSASGSMIGGNEKNNNNNNNNNNNANQQPASSVPATVTTTTNNHKNNNVSNTATTSTAAGSSSDSVSNIPSFAAVSMVTSDTETDEMEMSRLQAILEARGVPSHLLGALGPRMQTLLHRTIGSGSSTKAHQLVQGLKAHGDEGQQLQSVMEMCQLLVMGNEDTLAGFPVKLAVPNLIQLLNMDHNFDIMNHACRALTYMMESLPRSASVVVDAVPSFLEKLQVIQCMDVAEQSLTALEMLSRRHCRAILNNRGVSACLTYLDFFSINAQRSALTIAANCCQNIALEEFPYIANSLDTLSTHLTSTDKKSVESIVLAFSRLVEQFQHNPTILKQVADGNLLENLTQLLLATPSVISINTFVMIIRMMALMCQNCPELAVRLISSDIVSTIRYLLVGQKSNKNSTRSDVGTSTTAVATATKISMSDSSVGSLCKLNESVELLNRTPQELYEITSLITELMPRLPRDGIFAVNSLIEKNTAIQQESVSWQWRDERGTWHRYSVMDNKLIETAHRSGEEEITLLTMGKTYTIDFTTMQQINEETELSRPVQRKINHNQQQNHANATPGELSNQTPGSNKLADNLNPNRDPREELIKKNPAILDRFARSLFGVLYEIYSSSAGPAVRHKCLSALLRIIYYSTTDNLRKILKIHPVSSHIAAMLASSDQRILVGTIQMALILIEKLPDIFTVYFKREGVTHQFRRLATRSEQASGSKKDEVREWIIKQAQTFDDNTGITNDSQTSMSILNKLKFAIEMLDEDMFESLQQLKLLLSDGDISSFELIHSGLISNLIRFLTSVESDTNNEDRDNRVRAFLSVFLGLPEDPRHLLLLSNDFELKIDPVPLETLIKKLNACVSQLEQFPVRVHDFVGLGNGLGQTRGASALKFFNTHQLKCNLQRHPQCNNLRQWKGGPVKIDPLAIVQAIEKYLTVRGYAKIRDSADNSDDNSADEMDDGVSMMTQSTGRHRLQLSIGDQVLPYNMTVYQAIRQFGGFNALEMDSDWDMSITGQQSNNIWSDTHTIFYRPFIESLQSNSTQQQQQQQQHISQNEATTCSSHHQPAHQGFLSKRLSRSQAASTNSTVPVTSSSRSSTTHQQQATTGNTNTTSSSTNTSGSTASSSHNSTSPTRRYNTRNSSSSLYSYHYPRAPIVRKKMDEVWTEGKTPAVVSPIDPYLQPKLPQSVAVRDPSLEIIILLRTLFGLNRHWSWFYRNGLGFKTSQIIANSEFMNTKLAAKATRQLQDPLVIMTGNLPSWLSQLTYACPFLIPFETRQLLFYVTSFDRDRALQHLLDTTPELSNTDERVAPRLERRRKTVNREDLFRQSEIILNELNNSKTVLEIQYENEVGTGLGPTLEFYALVSREMQSADLELWRRPEIEHTQSTAKKYIYSPQGLFPQPLARNTKLGNVSRIRNRYKLLGKFMAKALMDSRMIDIDLSLPFYKWLLSQENTLDLIDMVQIDPTMSRTLFHMHRIAQLNNEMMMTGKAKNSAQSSISSAAGVTSSQVMMTAKSMDKLRQQIGSRHQLTSATNSTTSSVASHLNLQNEDLFANISPEVLTLDGCPIVDLNLDFTLPGYSSIELKKGGKSVLTKLENLDQYVKLLRYWTLNEGVRRQMEAFRAGFESIVPLHYLRIFYPEELNSLFCGSGYQPWDVRMLMDACKTDHGFTHESLQIKYLFEILSSYNAEEQRKFLQFITGSPRLPYGGLRSLSPPLTIVRKTLEPGQNPDHFLPSVMTCVNYLKLPEYSSCEIMREKLRISGEEGRNSFHLS